VTGISSRELLDKYKALAAIEAPALAVLPGEGLLAVQYMQLDGSAAAGIEPVCIMCAKLGFV